MSSDDAYLVPELADWNSGKGITLKAWISGVGRFDHALGYVAVFWPDFTQYEGCILRDKPDSTSYRSWMKNLNSDSAKVEAMMNHVHIIDLFPSAEYPPSKALVLRIGQLVRDMWSCKLARDFPGKHFEFELSSDSENIAEVELTFFQKH